MNKNHVYNFLVSVLGCTLAGFGFHSFLIGLGLFFISNSICNVVCDNIITSHNAQLQKLPLRRDA